MLNESYVVEAMGYTSGGPVTVSKIIKKDTTIKSKDLSYNRVISTLDAMPEEELEKRFGCRSLDLIKDTISIDTITAGVVSYINEVECYHLGDVLRDKATRDKYIFLGKASAKGMVRVLDIKRQEQVEGFTDQYERIGHSDKYESLMLYLLQI